MDPLSLFPQRADHHRVEAVVGYGGTIWEARLASSYGLETDLMNLVRRAKSKRNPSRPRCARMRRSPLLPRLAIVPSSKNGRAGGPIRRQHPSP